MIRHRVTLLLLLAAGCATGPQVRPCGHGGGVSLTAHLEDDEDQAAPFPGPWVPGRPVGLPVPVRVTVHNGFSYGVSVLLRCGTDDHASRTEVAVGAEQERDLAFLVPRHQGVSTHFYCEIEDFSSALDRSP